MNNILCFASKPVWEALNTHNPTMQQCQWCHSSDLGILGDVASAMISPFLFLRPFILRVCSLSRFCFCMCMRPSLVPKASWDMFFFFLGCASIKQWRNQMQIHLTEHTKIDCMRRLSRDWPSLPSVVCVQICTGRLRPCGFSSWQNQRKVRSPPVRSWVYDSRISSAILCEHDGNRISERIIIDIRITCRCGDERFTCSCACKSCRPARWSEARAPILPDVQRLLSDRRRNLTKRFHSTWAFILLYSGS